MSDQDMFNSDGQGTPPASKTVDNTDNKNTPPQNNELFNDQLASIKNEEGEQKYGSVDKALDALNHSQSYIKELKEQNEALSAEAQKVKELEAKIASMESVDEVVQKLTTQNQEPTNEATPPAGLSAEEVESLVQQQLLQSEAVKTAETNLNKVADAMTSKYGDKSADVIAAKAAELGTTPGNLGQLAQTSPDMVLALFKDVSVADAKPTTSTVNIPVNSGEQTLERPKMEKSILTGASSQDMVEQFKRSREYTMKRLEL